MSTYSGMQKVATKAGCLVLTFVLVAMALISVGAYFVGD